MLVKVIKVHDYQKDPDPENRVNFPYKEYTIEYQGRKLRIEMQPEHVVVTDEDGNELLVIGEVIIGDDCERFEFKVSPKLCS